MAAVAVLCLLAVQSVETSNLVATIGTPYEQLPFQPFSRCNDSGDAGDLMWDGSGIVSQAGIHYLTVEVTKVVYGGGTPSEIGLKAPISIGETTFSSPSPESFANITITLGVLYINITFADGTRSNLSATIFLPPIKNGTPEGCALLVIHNNQQAGFVIVFTPSSEPLDNPTLRYDTGGKVFQGRIYLIARADMASTTVVPPPTNPQTTNATLEYDLTNNLTENGTTCTYAWGPMFSIYRTGDSFEFNSSSTGSIDVYVFPSDWYNGTVSCSLGPILRAPYTPDKLPTGREGQYGPVMCLGCEREGGEASSSYVLFINHDPTLTPHVTLQAAVTLQATTTTTMASPPPSAIPFIGVPEIIIALLVGLFVVTRKRKRKLEPPPNLDRGRGGVA